MSRIGKYLARGSGASEPPAGSIAHLAEPYTIVRNNAPDAVVTELKKLASGRWYTNPGQDANFASLADAETRGVKIASVETPKSDAGYTVEAAPDVIDLDPLSAVERTLQQTGGILENVQADETRQTMGPVTAGPLPTDDNGRVLDAAAKAGKGLGTVAIVGGIGLALWFGRKLFK